MSDATQAGNSASDSPGTEHPPDSEHPPLAQASRVPPHLSHLAQLEYQGPDQSRRRWASPKELRILAWPTWLEWTCLAIAAVEFIAFFSPLDDAWTLTLQGVPLLSVILLSALDFVRGYQIKRSRVLPAGATVRNTSTRMKYFLLAVLYPALVASPIKPWARFWLSKPWLDSVAQQFLTTGTFQRGWHGLYNLQWVSKLPDSINFRIGAWENRRGIEYVLPGHRPSPAFDHHYLGGHWYAFD